MDSSGRPGHSVKRAVASASSLIHADGTAEIAEDLRKALTLAAPKRERESVFRWLGEEDSNPR